jgi:fructokinase
MKSNPEVTCIGELIVDFVASASRVSLEEAPGFVKAAGGSPANVAVGLARLGVRSSFVGKVGNDPFGRFLTDELRKGHVDTKGICVDPQHKTRLAFVSLAATGEREFEFWESSPADEQLRFRDVDIDRVARSRVVHISSFMLLTSSGRSTAFQIAKRARQEGCLVSFDPNLRITLWKSKTEARQVLLRMVKLSHILRLNEEEARFLTGRGGLRKTAEALSRRGPKLVVVTRGPDGCYFRSGSGSGYVKGFTVRAVDTTGCGDAFLAGLLCGIVSRKDNLEALSVRELSSICRYANAVGALTALKRGAIAAMPSSPQVERFLVNRTRVFAG